MRLTVFGGTGPTGQLLIQQALEAGHTVTALARNPAKLATRDGLTLIEGQLTDPAAIGRAVTNADAVISLLGPPSKPAWKRVEVAPILDGYRTIVAAMATHGVKRMVALGTPSITDPADRREPAFSLLVAIGKRIRPAAYTIMVGIGEIVRASDLDWTIVGVPSSTTGRAPSGSMSAPSGTKAAFDCRVPTPRPTSSNKPRTPAGSTRPPLSPTPETTRSDASHKTDNGDHRAATSSDRRGRVLEEAPSVAGAPRSHDRGPEHVGQEGAR